MAIDTVVVAIGLDEDEHEIASTVVDVAGPADATVELLHVYEESEFDDIVRQLDYEFDPNVTPGEVTRHLSSIMEIVDHLEAADVEYDVDGAIGKYGPLIVRESANNDADLVVVGGEKQSPAGKAFFGSTAQHVLLNADCPVLFVKNPPTG